jgi:RimJ/RimL family protein N-acetyltransferase
MKRYRKRMLMTTPTLTTARLTMRAHQLADFADSAAMWGDPIVTRHIGGRPFSPEEVWTRLLRHAGHWALLGFGYWVVLETQSGKFVGEVGFADLHRALEPAIHGLPELGWVLAPWAHGRGLATEAVQAALAWGAGALLAGRTVCIIDPDNRASLRVADKTGFRRVTETTYHGHPTVLLERPL